MARSRKRRSSPVRIKIAPVPKPPTSHKNQSTANNCPSAVTRRGMKRRRSVLLEDITKDNITSVRAAAGSTDKSAAVPAKCSSTEPHNAPREETAAREETALQQETGPRKTRRPPAETISKAVGGIASGKKGPRANHGLSHQLSVSLQRCDSLEMGNLAKSREEAIIHGEGEETIIHGGGEEARIQEGGEEATIHGGVEEARIHGGGEEARIHGGGEETRIQEGTEEARIHGGVEEARIHGGGEETRIHGGGEETRIHGGGEETRIQEGTEEARIHGGGEEAFHTADEEAEVELICVEPSPKRRRLSKRRAVKTRRSRVDRSASHNTRWSPSKYDRAPGTLDTADLGRRGAADLGRRGARPGKSVHDMSTNSDTDTGEPSPAVKMNNILSDSIPTEDSYKTVGLPLQTEKTVTEGAVSMDDTPEVASEGSKPATKCTRGCYGNNNDVSSDVLRLVKPCAVTVTDIYAMHRTSAFKNKNFVQKLKNKINQKARKSLRLQNSPSKSDVSDGSEVLAVKSDDSSEVLADITDESSEVLAVKSDDSSDVLADITDDSSEVLAVKSDDSSEVLAEALNWSDTEPGSPLLFSDTSSNHGDTEDGLDTAPCVSTGDGVSGHHGNDDVTPAAPITVVEAEVYRDATGDVQTSGDAAQKPRSLRSHSNVSPDAAPRSGSHGNQCVFEGNLTITDIKDSPGSEEEEKSVVKATRDPGDAADGSSPTERSVSLATKPCHVVLVRIVDSKLDINRNYRLKP